MPVKIVEQLKRDGIRPLICALEGFEPEVPDDYERLRFRLETFGTFIKQLKRRRITQICLAGAVQRPAFKLSALDVNTMRLVPRIVLALSKGDDGALRTVVTLFEEAGIKIVAAHDIVPSLLAQSGVPTRAKPLAHHERDACVGQSVLDDMGRLDTGQACVILNGAAIARETADGTDAMLGGLTAEAAKDSIFFKGPKPNQDRRMDLPVIGLKTVQNAARAGCSGIVLESGGVMVIDRDDIVRFLDDNDMFLWMRERQS